MTVSVFQAEACNTDTTPTQPHGISNTHRTKNNTTDVVIQQNSLKFMMMDILMSETCWAHKKWNKIASDIKLVFYSSATAFLGVVSEMKHTDKHNFLIILSFYENVLGIRIKNFNVKWVVEAESFVSRLWPPFYY